MSFQRIKKYLKEHLFFILIFIGMMVLSGIFQRTWAPMKEAPGQLINDVDQYYSYLPAAFIHKDLRFKYPNSYWLIKNQNGINLPKVSMGMSYLYTPFFMIGHAIALNTDYKADGYSKPYYTSIAIGGFIYVCIALFILYHCLIFFFPKITSSLTVMIVYLGTNLFYYSVNFVSMPHGHLFLVFSIVLFLTIKYYQNYKNITLYFLAFFIGLAIIIRPSAGLILLLPLFYGVYNLKSLKERGNLIFQKRKPLLVSLFFLLIPIIPQLIYWKWVGGSWLVYSYGEEGFYFSNPHIMEFLVGFRKGWFIYTPIMILVIPGLFLLKKRAKNFSFLLPLVFGLTIFIFSSWWCWWFGGGFGMRAMVQYYVLFAIPLAALIQEIFERSISLKLVGAIMISIGVMYNFYVTYKFNHFQIHWDGMTKEAWVFSVTKRNFSEEDYVRFEQLLDFPDYDEAKKGPQK